MISVVQTLPMSSGAKRWSRMGGVDVGQGHPDPHLADLAGDGAPQGVPAVEQNDRSGCIHQQPVVEFRLSGKGPAVGVADVFEAVALQVAPQAPAPGREALGLRARSGTGRGRRPIVAGVEGFRLAPDGRMAIGQPREGGAASALGV